MKRIAVISVGGTIAMRDNGQGASPALDAQALVSGLGFDNSGDIRLEPDVFLNVPSAHVTVSDIYALWRKTRTAFEDGVSAVIITHGTDTIEDTAYALSLIHHGHGPIILTGAMRPSSALSSDGPANLRDAVITAAHMADNRVVVVMNAVVHDAYAVTKAHTSALDAFVSRNNAACGTVVEGKFLWPNSWSASWSASWPDRPRSNQAGMPVPDRSRARVHLVKTYPGDDGLLLQKLGDDMDGLVIEALGGGHVPPPLLPLLDKLARKIPVVFATRCFDGPVLRQSYNYIGSEIDLIERGLIPAELLNASKARLALTIMLDSGYSCDNIRAFFAAA